MPNRTRRSSQVVALFHSGDIVMDYADELFHDPTNTDTELAGEVVWMLHSNLEDFLIPNL